MAHAWMDHAAAWWAWERVYDLVQNDKPAAWHMIQVMVAYAPDYGSLGSVAAGPVEDLMGGKYLKLMREEAQSNPRFRICLGMTNGLPEELEPFAEKRNKLEVLPPSQSIEATPDEIKLMVAYFHHSDTGWASLLFSELNHNKPDEALFMIRLLLDQAEKYSPQLTEEVFSAVDSFIHVNFGAYQQELKALAMERESLRQWFLRKTWPPINDSEGWAAFLDGLRTA